MFDMFNSTENPFAALMNLPLLNTDDEEEMPEADLSAFQDMQEWGMDGFGEDMDFNPMELMRQGFMMHMMFMQNMFMMPMYMMQFMKKFYDTAMAQQENMQEEKSTEPAEGFKLGNMTIPPELLTKLMQMEMSPENLQKLQKVLDFVFAAMPDQKAE